VCKHLIFETISSHHDNNDSNNTQFGKKPKLQLHHEHYVGRKAILSIQNDLMRKIIERQDHFDFDQYRAQQIKLMKLHEDSKRLHYFHTFRNRTLAADIKPPPY
jgi:hypothetical protein